MLDTICMDIKMTLTSNQSILLILTMATVTFITRVLPFIIFSGKKETPKYVAYLGKALPYAIISMLIVYCLKDVKVLTGSHGLPEFISIVVITVIHIWKKNTLLSIGVGTVLYMFLVQVGGM